MYQIPLFDLNYDEKESEAVSKTLKSGWISSGPKCLELEALFCKEFHCAYACATANCTGALHLALLSLGLGQEDEVIVPSLTFAATVNAVKYVNAIPVFCDVEGPENPTLSPSQLEQLITPKTKAVIVMHYAGYPCNMDKIMELAKRHHLYIIEDACHGPLSEYRGKKLGTIGDIGCFSFFSNKNISAGEGGMIITDSKKLADKIRLLRSHGMTTMSYERSKGHAANYEICELGYNYRLDDIRASLAIVQLNKLPEDLKKRAAVRKRYEINLEHTQEIIVPFRNNREPVSNYIFPVILKHSSAVLREYTRNKLKDFGIQTSVHYPAVHQFELYKNSVHGSMERTKYISDCELSLPMYGNLELDEVDYICRTLKNVLEEMKNECTGPGRPL